MKKQLSRIPKARYPIVSIRVWTASGHGSEPTMQEWRLRESDIRIVDGRFTLTGTLGTTPKFCNIVQRHSGEAQK